MKLVVLRGKFIGFWVRHPNDRKGAMYTHRLRQGGGLEQSQTPEYFEYCLPSMNPAAQPVNDVHPVTSESYSIEYDQLYQSLMVDVLNRSELETYGYPLEGITNITSIFDMSFNKHPDYPDVRTCCRCGSFFFLKDNFYAAESNCTYHRDKKVNVEGRSVYKCCGKGTCSDGCITSEHHVCAQAFQNYSNFVKTQVKEGNRNKRDIYALDCEMCFTVKGLEVTKVSVVDVDGSVVYDTFVRPEHEVLDYNTAFSGITERDLRNVKTTLMDVHAVLLRLFNSMTILIGHGLYNDLKALHLIHENVIDTAVVWPHARGLPFLRSLKSLVASILGQQIEAHNSVEDARACMNLMLFKVRKQWSGLLMKQSVPIRLSSPPPVISNFY